MALEVAAAEVAFLFHVTDEGLDGGAPPELAFDDAEDAALLSRDEDAARVLGVMTAVTLVDIAALDLAACKLLGILDDLTQGVTIIGIAGQSLRRSHLARRHR